MILNMKFKIIPAQHLVVETLIDFHLEYYKDDKYKESQSWKEWEWDNISELQSAWDLSRLV